MRGAIHLNLQSLLVVIRYGQEDGSGQARANRQMRVDHLIQQASAFDVQLSNLLSRRMRGEEGFKHVMTLRFVTSSLVFLWDENVITQSIQY
jgi:hypothetical protein